MEPGHLFTVKACLHPFKQPQVLPNTANLPPAHTTTTAILHRETDTMLNIAKF